VAGRDMRMTTNCDHDRRRQTERSVLVTYALL
jgi:hypothetical protein